MNKNIDWFAITIIAIWLISAVACFATRNADPLIVAFITTIVSGFGYMLVVT